MVTVTVTSASAVLDRGKVKIIDPSQTALSPLFCLLHISMWKSERNLKFNPSKTGLTVSLTPHSYPHSSCFLCSVSTAESYLSPKSTLFDFSLTCHASSNHGGHSSCFLRRPRAQPPSLPLASWLRPATSLSRISDSDSYSILPLVLLLLPERVHSLKGKSDVPPWLKILPWLPAALGKNKKFEHPLSVISLAANLTPSLTAPAVLNFSS